MGMDGVGLGEVEQWMERGRVGFKWGGVEIIRTSWNQFCSEREMLTQPAINSPIFHSISYDGGNSMTHCFFLHTLPPAPFHQLIQFGLMLRELNQRPQLPLEAQHLL